MKKIVIIYDEKSLDNSLTNHINSILKSIWVELGGEVIEYKIDENSSVERFYKWMEATDPDYLCSLDMSGFSVNTLTGNRYYNICYAKQIHIVMHNKIWDFYAEELFALNLYMFLPGDTEQLRKRYTKVPNLYGYEKFKCNENDRIVLETIVHTALADILGMEDIRKL